MAWIYLFIAGLLEIFWALSLKYTDGFAKLWPTIATVCGMIASFYFLAHALKAIPVGTGYAVWTGIGAAGTALLGIVLFAEPASPSRLLCIVLNCCGYCRPEIHIELKTSRRCRVPVVAVCPMGGAVL